MRRSISRLLIGLCAAPLTLASSAALAASGPEACNNIELVASGQCEFELAGGCEADCTTLSVVAACDGKCAAGATTECTTGCLAMCEGACDANPATFECESSCTDSCEKSCMTSCSDASCQAQCHGSCDHRCKVGCAATPGSADCATRCATSCGASCKVQANVDCALTCSATLEGACKVQCQQPKGSLFCGDQYVDVSGSFDDCVTYLESKGLGFSVTGGCVGATCEGSASIGCSAAPSVGAIGDEHGVGAVAGLVMGLGLFVSRRRRRG